MFKSIQQSLQRRLQSIARQADATEITQRALYLFLQENYPGVSARVSVRYQDADHVLIIATQNKTLAGELSLHTAELQQHLGIHGVRVERIIVR